MVSCSNLHCCLVIGDIRYYSGNEYKLLNSCLIGNCNNCSSVQYYFGSEAFGLKSYFDKINKPSKIITGLFL